MVSGISQNFAAQGMVGTPNNPVYIQQSPAFAYAPSADTVELSGNKKSGSKKSIFAAIGTAFVAAAALFYGVKSGKLTKIDNPTKLLYSNHYCLNIILFLLNLLLLL